MAANSIDPTAARSQVDNLVSRLSDRSSLLRVQALEAIDLSAAIDAEKADGILRDALDDRDPLVGEAAIRALLERGDEQLRLVRESDLEKYPGETSELVHTRMAALHQDAPALRELMRNGDALVQESAFEALASDDASAAVEALRAEFLDPASLHRVQTLDLYLRSPYTNSPATLMPILEVASKDEDPLVRDRAKQALQEMKAEASVR